MGEQIAHTSPDGVHQTLVNNNQQFDAKHFSHCSYIKIVRTHYTMAITQSAPRNLALSLCITPSGYPSTRILIGGYMEDK